MSPHHLTAPRRRFAAALCFTVLAACSSEPRPAAAPDPEPAAPAAPVAPAPAPPAIAEAPDPTPEELPLPEDFEVEAEQQITPDNFQSELDAIEKDMDAENAQK